MVPIERTGQNYYRLLSILCDAKYIANAGAFFMGNLGFDAWSDATDGETSNGSLTQGLMGSGY